MNAQSDHSGHPPETTTLIAELLHPDVLRKLGVSLRGLAERLDCREQSLRRLREGLGVHNRTAVSLATSLEASIDDLFLPRSLDAAAEALAAYLDEKAEDIFGRRPQ